MSAELLARVQFGLTAGFHFLFPPLTIGLGWINVWILARYLRTRDDLYRRMARFWIRVFALTFAVGVATGITLEFQFGTNWSEYSRFVGDIFGAPLAAEGILSFFLESTFLAVLLFGWGRVSPRAYFVSSMLVAFGATLSAFWIIVANSWQQTPAGYTIDPVSQRAVLTNFWAAVFNPSTVPRYLHTVDASLITGSLFVLGLSAWFILKGRHLDFAKESMRIALIVALISSLAQLGLGHMHAVQVAETQPLKLAAGQALFETQRRAPILLFGIPDEENERIIGEISVPAILSILVAFDPNAEVKGLKDFQPKSDWPPVAVTYFSWHLMVICGTFFIGLTVLGVYLARIGRLYTTRWYLWLAVLAIPLPFIANELGWICAEVGRQPWAVYGMLRTADAVSVVVPAGEVLASIILISTIYGVLFAAWVLVLRRIMREGPEPSGEEADP
ncbi:MAG TPA: cytochrome ubiquinol oxidase subunit I [Armatimonadota bacterium]|nr:cytochrome ubiquinol oxidase subunit I [Armatimonadota bacterium]